MSQAELHEATGKLIIRSTCYFYGDGATAAFARQIAEDIEHHWNEPAASVVVRKKEFKVRFEIAGIFEPALLPETVWYNDDPKLNFFRVEQYVTGNISFVDGIGCNTGYFKIDNLVQTSTTAAHEYGHSIGLLHPRVLDIRHGLEPRIMYPRGTLCDAPMQYDPTAEAGKYGGFLDPKFRKVSQRDIEELKLHKLDFDRYGLARLGEFSSIYHEKHSEPAA